MRGARPALRIVDDDEAGTFGKFAEGSQSEPSMEKVHEANLLSETGSQSELVKDSDAASLNTADCGVSRKNDTGSESFPPAVLPPEIAEEWRRVVGDLRERRLFKDSMAGMVTSYVLAQATAMRLEIQIAAEGASVPGAGGALKPHPATGLLRSSRETVARLGAELGLSPTARSRKQLRPDPGQSNLFGQDEFDL